MPFPSPGDLHNSGTESLSPALQVDSLPSEPQGTQPEGWDIPRAWALLLSWLHHRLWQGHFWIWVLRHVALKVYFIRLLCWSSRRKAMASWSNLKKEMMGFQAITTTKKKKKKSPIGTQSLNILLRETTKMENNAPRITPRKRTAWQTRYFFLLYSLFFNELASLAVFKAWTGFSLISYAD